MQSPKLAMWRLLDPNPLVGKGEAGTIHEFWFLRWHHTTTFATGNIIHHYKRPFFHHHSFKRSNVTWWYLSQCSQGHVKLSKRKHGHAAESWASIVVYVSLMFWIQIYPNVKWKSCTDEACKAIPTMGRPSSWLKPQIFYTTSSRKKWPVKKII